MGTGVLIEMVLYYYFYFELTQSIVCMCVDQKKIRCWLLRNGPVYLLLYCALSLCCLCLLRSLAHECEWELPIGQQSLQSLWEGQGTGGGFGPDEVREEEL